MSRADQNRSPLTETASSSTRLLRQFRADRREPVRQLLDVLVEPGRMAARGLDEPGAGFRPPGEHRGLGKGGRIAQIARQLGKSAANTVDLVAELADAVERIEDGSRRQREDQQARQISNPDRADERGIIGHAQALRTLGTILPCRITLDLH